MMEESAVVESKFRAVSLPDVLTYLAARLGRNCSASEELFSSRLLNSLDLLEVIAWAESRFGVDVEPGELSLIHFDTAAKFSEFIDRKRSAE